MNIKADHLHLRFGKHEALKDISFELEGNKIYGLLGRNGAGKTSLLSLIGSFREPTSGTLTINGENPFEHAATMQKVLFMYDKDYSDYSEKVNELLGDMQRYRPFFDKEYAEYLLALFKIDINKPIKKLSKGMQSAVNVSMGLASRTPITIFDEVYLGMDAPSRDIFYEELLKDQEKHPRMIILSTHLVSEMEYLFEDVVIIHEGNVLLQEDYESIISKGTSITGHKETVDAIIGTKKTMNEQQLGNTKSVMLYGELSEIEAETALEQGLELGHISLHDLFIHLTKEEPADENLS